MKNILFGVLAGLFFCTVSTAAEFVLNSKYAIVIPQNASDSEKFAARQLQKYLNQTTGTKLEISTSGSPAIFVRQDKKLTAERWKIFADSRGDLHITGGYPTGVLYAVYEFLETQAGIRFLAPDAEYIPKNKKISFSSELKIENEPFFRRREVYLISAVMRRHGEYLGKMRFSGTWIAGKHVDPYRFGSTGTTHSYHILARDFPKDKMEYFSLNKSGKRVRFRNGLGPGQLCLTHPEVRKLVAEKMIKLIEADRKRWDIPPLFYALCKNDNSEDCVCPNCLAAVKKYGGNHAGLNLEFVSDIARKVGKVYPDVLIRTSAYTTDEIPVKNFKLPPNVLLGIAQLGSEFKTAVRRDSLRKLSHPNNEKALMMLKEWRKSCSHMMSWDYWVLFRQQFSAPMTNVSAIAHNLKTYASMNLRQIFAESETAPANLISFLDLRHYTASKLLIDPRQDTRKIIAEFMRLYYGPAAAEMTAYLNYLEQRMAEETNRLGSTPPNAWKYLDKKFFDDVEKMLSAAEKAAAGNKLYLDRIGQERILVDNALLCFGERKGIRFDKKQVICRLQKNMNRHIERFGDAKLQKKWKKETAELISYYAFQPPLPKQFDNKKIFDFHGPKLQVFNTVIRKIADKDSVTGSAICLSDLSAIKKSNPKFHQQPVRFSLFDRVTQKTLISHRVKNIPQDEKYHWYRIGTSVLSRDNRIILHGSWWLTQSVGSTVFDPLEPNAKYEIWVSVKLTGKDYVKTSKKQSAIWLDRIVFVETVQR